MKTHVFPLALLLMSFAFTAQAHDPNLPASEVLKDLKNAKPLPATWNITKHAHFDDEVFYTGGTHKATDVICSVGISSYVTNKEINKIMQDPQGRLATKAKWVAEKIPGSIFPPYFFNAKLVLKPDLVLPITSTQSLFSENRECLRWETDLSTGDHLSYCVEHGKVLSHYFATYVVMKVHGVDLTASCSQSTNDLSKKELTWGDFSNTLSGILHFQL